MVPVTRSAIEGKVWTQVRKMVWILVPSQTSSTVRGQVWSQVWVTVSDRVWGHVRSRIINQANEDTDGSRGG
jgi:hypothetical protein